MLFGSKIVVKLHIITSKLIAFVSRVRNDYSFYKFIISFDIALRIYSTFLWKM